MATKQATIAFKVASPSGAPLDINGKLISVTGRKQAIALLAGQVNPNPDKYEVEFYFQLHGVVDGNPTFTYDGTCPSGNLTVTPAHLLLGPDNQTGTLTLSSSNDWHIEPVNFVDFDVKEGGAGVFTIIAKTTATEGQGYVNFVDDETGEIVKIYISNLSVRVWILATGQWNMNGFWYMNETWNFL